MYLNTRNLIQELATSICSICGLCERGWSNLKIVQIWGDGDAYAEHMSDRMSGADGQKPNRIRR